MLSRAVAGIGLTFGLALLAAAPQPAAVRVWAATVRLPTYAEGPANPNPPFDLFTFGRFNYPYPIRDALTDTRELVTWRTLHLENEYLRLTVLPDLGGHIHSCLDTRSGREMFYANTAIKKALIGYRGAWAALGVEFNFPVSHNWVSMSPVDFATKEQSDGSGSIWIGNTDQVYGSRWRVELSLQPGRAVVEQKVDLYNAGDVRHRYYWWSNAAARQLSPGAPGSPVPVDGPRARPQQRGGRSPDRDRAARVLGCRGAGELSRNRRALRIRAAQACACDQRRCSIRRTKPLTIPFSAHPGFKRDASIS